MANQIIYTANISPATASMEVSYNAGSSWSPLTFTTSGSVQTSTQTSVPAGTYAAGQVMLRGVGFPASAVSNTTALTVTATAAAQTVTANSSTPS